MNKAVMRDVVRVVEMNGPNGAVHLVHILECGCWVIRGKKPRRRMACVSCSLRPIEVGAPRVVDIAWQAWQASQRWWVNVGRFVFGDIPIEPTEAANRAFREWWAKR